MQANKLVLTVEKNKGRKRHIVVDSLGCILAVKVHRANLHDTKSGIFVAISAYRKYPSIQKYVAMADIVEVLLLMCRAF